MSFYQNNTLLAVSYIESFPGAETDGPGPENFDYARAAHLAGFGDAQFVCGEKTVRDLDSGKLKFFDSLAQALDFIEKTMARWMEKEGISEEYAAPAKHMMTEKARSLYS